MPIGLLCQPQHRSLYSDTPPYRFVTRITNFIESDSASYLGRAGTSHLRRRRRKMTSTTIVAISMAATTSCPKVLDIPVGSISEVCTGGPTVSDSCRVRRLGSRFRSGPLADPAMLRRASTALVGRSGPARYCRRRAPDRVSRTDASTVRSLPGPVGCPRPCLFGTRWADRRRSAVRRRGPEGRLVRGMRRLRHPRSLAVRATRLASRGWRPTISSRRPGGVGKSRSCVARPELPRSLDRRVPDGLVA